jgi:cob(I)alamin adenosyltransferase
MSYKIYTKTGDKGETSLIGGTRVPKFHERIEAYGTLDELNVFVGAIRDFDISAELQNQLIGIQDRLMVISALLATDSEELQKKQPQITDEDIQQLESYIDNFDEELPPLKAFVIPGGLPVSSAIHKARVICRNAERKVIALAQTVDVNPLLIRYLNRLSDYLFTLSRKVEKDFSFEPTPWMPKSSK